MHGSIRIHTFGCRLNQVESEGLAEAFARAGFRVLTGDGDGEDIAIFNTCTVTSKAEQKARRLIRSALRANPRAVAIVTGCYAEMEPEAVAALGARVVAVPGTAKDALLSLPERLASGEEGHDDPLDAIREALSALGGGPRDPFAFSPGAFSFHSRASLKVEDGCDNACAFCRVHLARGPARSLGPAEALRRVRALEASGYAETVLTGVNLSHYSSEGLDFSALLSSLVRGTESMAFRISSYEPDRVDGAFLEAVSHPRVRPFFHLPVQSGSPATLARMGRHADVDALENAIRGLRQAKDDPFVSFDMICGFPGESDAEFRESADFARRARPAWMHVFTYSPRPGTPAAAMPSRVPERIAVERAARLSGLARQGRSDYAARWYGRKVEAVLEGPLSPREGSGADGGRYAPLIGEAFTENALRVGLYAAEGAGRDGSPNGNEAGRSLSLDLRPPDSPDFDAAAFIFA